LNPVGIVRFTAKAATGPSRVEAAGAGADGRIAVVVAEAVGTATGTAGATRAAQVYTLTLLGLTNVTK
jgi:hypothetical protein